jgi:hypothetical protein
LCPDSSIGKSGKQVRFKTVLHWKWQGTIRATLWHYSMQLRQFVDFARPSQNTDQRLGTPTCAAQGPLPGAPCPLSLLFLSPRGLILYAYVQREGERGRHRERGERGERDLYRSPPWPCDAASCCLQCQILHVVDTHLLSHLSDTSPPLMAGLLVYRQWIHCPGGGLRAGTRGVDPGSQGAYLLPPSGADALP